ncbi:MAG TPA: hypothetical protein VFJ50_03535 [Gemmatimonadales bacterium]|nr:hypothetical protein [Gemmatimonadales bacterium]
MTLASLRKGEPQWEEREGDRLLSDAHFEFQGGSNSPKAPPGVERRMLQRGPEIR